MIESVKDRVVRIVAEQALLAPSDVSLDQTLEDLSIDSMALVEAIFAIEEEFDIRFATEEITRLGKLGDLITLIDSKKA